jgi:CubicO group peptidase (beta-lactamase class C family)
MRRELAHIMDDATARGEVPCVLALLWRGGEERFCHLSGHADLGRAEMLTRDAIFRWYSLTKPVTAVAAMALVERGALDIMAPVSDYLPAFAQQRVALSSTRTVPARRPMLVRDLFSMTSGLCYPGEASPAQRAAKALFEQFYDDTATGNQPDTQTFANAMGELPLAFHPGEGFEYGTSADVLGAVVEIAAGMPLDEFLQETVFGPLGMADTGFYVPQGQQHRLTTLYEKRDGLFVPYLSNSFGPSQYLQRPNFLSGGAGLTGTADDALRFGRMLLGEGKLYGERVLSPYGVKWLTQNHLTPAQRAMTTFDSLLGQGYGGLMRVLEEPAKSFTLGAEGEFGWDGWAGAYMSVCPAENMVLILFQQLTDTGTNALARRLRNVLYANLG